MSKSFKNIKTKKCKVCSSILGTRNKSGLCNYHLTRWWFKNTDKGKALIKKHQKKNNKIYYDKHKERINKKQREDYKKKKNESN